MAATKKGNVWVGFDLGGTKMMAAVFDHEFKSLGSKLRKTRSRGGRESGLDRMIRTIREALDDAGVPAGQVAGIGVGCPGPIDMDRGVVFHTPSLGWKNVPVQETLEGAFGRPVAVANDVDIGVYGEYRFGAAKGARCVIGVFPGTGIGGGCVYEGRIFRGKVGSCLEIGHMPVSSDGPLCGCGRRGCLETYAGRLAISAASATAAHRGQAPYLLKHAGTNLAEIRSGSLSAAIKAGDEAVEQIIRNAASRIGWVMAGVVNLMAPDLILLGGGLVESMPELFRDEIEQAANDRVMESFQGTFKVVVAELAGDAAVTGAAAWARHLVETKN